jgi:hypothetical protein
MRFKLPLLLALAILLMTESAAFAKKKDVRNEPVVPKTKHPTYEDAVVEAFKQIFPERAEISYAGVTVGVKRKNVICEECKRDGNNFWITCRAKYVGTFGSGPLKQEVGAERVRIYYENGNVKVDLGGLKGAINTKSAKKVIEAAIKKWIKGKV